MAKYITDNDMASYADEKGNTVAVDKIFGTPDLYTMSFSTSIASKLKMAWAILFSKKYLFRVFFNNAEELLQFINNIVEMIDK